MLRLTWAWPEHVKSGVTMTLLTPITLILTEQFWLSVKIPETKVVDFSARRVSYAHSLVATSPLKRVVTLLCTAGLQVALALLDWRFLDLKVDASFMLFAEVRQTREVAANRDRNDCIVRNLVVVNIIIIIIYGAKSTYIGFYWYLKTAYYWYLVD